MIYLIDHCKIKHGRKRRKPERGNVAARLKKQAEALEQCLNTTPPPNKEDGYKIIFIK